MVNKSRESEEGSMSREPARKADRRKHRRIGTPLKARFLDQYNDERNCTVINASAGGAFLQTQHPPELGSSVVLYIDQLGRFEGLVTRVEDNKFAVNYETRRRRSIKTADHLTEVSNLAKRDHDRRSAPRIAETDLAKVYLEDGRSAECAILDISLTGASIEIAPRPPLGARLKVGRMNATVVRRHDKGVSVVFTSNNDRMNDVIENSTETKPVACDQTGAKIARKFGKKSD